MNCNTVKSLKLLHVAFIFLFSIVDTQMKPPGNRGGRKHGEGSKQGDNYVYVTVGGNLWSSPVIFSDHQILVAPIHGI